MTLEQAFELAHLAIVAAMGVGFAAAITSSLMVALTPDVTIARRVAQIGWGGLFIGAVLLIAIQTLDQLV